MKPTTTAAVAPSFLAKPIGASALAKLASISLTIACRAQLALVSRSLS